MGVLTTREFAEQVGVTYGRIVQLIQSGELKAEKLGHIYMIDSKFVPVIKNRKNKAGRPRKNSQGATQT